MKRFLWLQAFGAPTIMAHVYEKFSLITGVWCADDHRSRLWKIFFDYRHLVHRRSSLTFMKNFLWLQAFGAPTIIAHVYEKFSLITGVWCADDHRSRLWKIFFDYRRLVHRRSSLTFMKNFLWLQAFGAPTIIAHVNGKKEMVFGSDRFPILAQMLGKMKYSDFSIR